MHKIVHKIVHKISIPSLYNIEVDNFDLHILKKTFKEPILICKVNLTIENEIVLE